MTRARRRRFGSVRRLNRHGRDYLEASYPTPQDAFARWPGLPRRQSRMLPAEYAAELDAWLADAEKRITLGSWTPPQVERAEQERDGITFADYAYRWADTHRRADGELVRGSARSKHLEIIELYLIPAFGDRGMRDITVRDVQHWWDAFRPVSRHANREKRRLQAYKTLHAIMSSAATEPVGFDGRPIIDRNPCAIRAARPKVDHEPVIAEADQIRALADAMPERLAPTVILAGTLGLREGECLALMRRDVDLRRMILHVRHSVSMERDPHGRWRPVIGEPKTGSSVRDIRIPDTLRPWLERALRNAQPGANGLLFPARDGGPMRPQTLRNLFAKARDRVPGLEGMWFHDLRKTALTAFAAAGATNGEVMRLGGHTSLDVASIYQRSLDSHLDDVYRRLEGGGAEKPSADGGDAATAAALAALPVAPRMAALNALDGETRLRVTLLMDEPARSETVRLLLGEAS